MGYTVFLSFSCMANKRIYGYFAVESYVHTPKNKKVVSSHKEPIYE